MPPAEPEHLECEACAATGPDAGIVEADSASRYRTLCDRCSGVCGECNGVYWYRELSNDLCATCGDICEQCHERCPARNMDEHHLCEGCQIVCDNCGTHYRDDDDFDDGLCADCSMPHCENCGESCDSLNAEGFCAGCSPSYQHIHDYSYRPKAKFIACSDEKAAPDTLYLGVELEMEAGPNRIPDDDVGDLLDAPEWYAKYDGSLANGVEIVSHPATYAWWSKQATTEWMAAFQAKGYRSYETTTCGMHVHVSRAGLTRGAVYRLLEFVKQNRSEILKLSRRKEENLNRWAAVDTQGTPGLVRKALRYETTNRYEAVNCVPSKTIEFRFFRGTLDRVGFHRNVDLVWAVCSFVKRASNRGLGFSEFVKWLKGKGSRPFLTQKNADRLIAWFVDLGLTTRKEVSQCV